jgi:hypothetical protein
MNMAAIEKGKGSEETQATAAKRTYTVAGPGNIFAGGKFYTAGEAIELTEADAAGFGASVYAGRPKALDVFSKRRAGKYVVAVERNVWSEGKLLTTGTELNLGEAEARSLGDAIEPATVA